MMSQVNPEKFESLLTKYFEFKYVGHKSFVSHDFIKRFEITFYSLDKEQQFILENEYLNKSNKSWWKSHYTKTSFFLVKTTALESFCNTFYGLL